MQIPSKEEAQTGSDPHTLHIWSVAEQLSKTVKGGGLEQTDLGQVTRGESRSEVIQGMADTNKCAFLKTLTKVSSSS